MSIGRIVSIVFALGWALTAGPLFAQGTIKIGVTQPLTGAFAASGNYVAQGAKMAEDDVNKAGGVLGKKIELVVEDNKSNPTEAVATAEKLIQRDKVPVMMGAWSSTLTLAVMPKLMEYEVPMLVETSSSGKITTSGNPWIFRISPTSEMEAKAFTPLVKTLGIKKADLLYTNNDFGIGAAQEFSTMLKASGVEIGAPSRIALLPSVISDAVGGRVMRSIQATSAISTGVLGTFGRLGIALAPLGVGERDSGTPRGRASSTNVP